MICQSKHLATLLLLLLLITAASVRARAEDQWHHVRNPQQRGLKIEHLATDEATGSIYAAGMLTAAVTVGGQTYTPTTPGSAFVARMNAFGEPLWLRPIQSDSAIHVASFLWKPGLGLVLGGAFQKNLAAGSFSAANGQLYDAFLLAVNQYGSPLWLRRSEGEGNEALRALTLGPGGELHAAMALDDTATFGSITLYSAAGEITPLLRSHLDVSVLKVSDAGQTSRAIKAAERMAFGQYGFNVTPFLMRAKRAIGSYVVLPDTTGVLALTASFGLFGDSSRNVDSRARYDGAFFLRFDRNRHTLFLKRYIGQNDGNFGFNDVSGSSIVRLGTDSLLLPYAEQYQTSYGFHGYKVSLNGGQGAYVPLGGVWSNYVDGFPYFELRNAGSKIWKKHAANGYGVTLFQYTRYNQHMQQEASYVPETEINGGTRNARCAPWAMASLGDGLVVAGMMEGRGLEFQGILLDADSTLMPYWGIYGPCTPIIPTVTRQGNVLTGQVPAGTPLQWYKYGGGICGAVGYTYTLKPGETGRYQLQTVYNGCRGRSEPVTAAYQEMGQSAFDTVVLIGRAEGALLSTSDEYSAFNLGACGVDSMYKLSQTYLPAYYPLLPSFENLVPTGDSGLMGLAYDYFNSYYDSITIHGTNAWFQEKALVRLNADNSVRFARSISANALTRLGPDRHVLAGNGSLIFINDEGQEWGRSNYPGVTFFNVAAGLPDKSFYVLGQAGAGAVPVSDLNPNSSGQGLFVGRLDSVGRFIYVAYYAQEDVFYKSRSLEKLTDNSVILVGYAVDSVQLGTIKLKYGPINMMGFPMPVQFGFLARLGMDGLWQYANRVSSFSTNGLVALPNGGYATYFADSLVRYNGANSMVWKVHSPTLRHDPNQDYPMAADRLGNIFMGVTATSDFIPELRVFSPGGTLLKQSRLTGIGLIRDLILDAEGNVAMGLGLGRYINEQNQSTAYGSNLALVRAANRFAPECSAPVVADTSVLVCGTQGGTLSATAGAGCRILWYTQPTGGTPAFEGENVVIDPVVANLFPTFYVETVCANGECVSSRVAVHVAVGTTAQINSISPATGPAGTTVTVTGANFNSVILVRLSGRQVSFDRLSNATIAFNVPEGAESGRISMLTGDGADTCRAQSGSTFTVQSTTPEFPMTATTRTACSGNYTDPQGAAANYANNLYVTQTLQPATAGAKLQLDFSAFALSDNDQLYVYDGPTSASPLLKLARGTASPGKLVSTHASGALTVRFYSNTAGTDAGFLARISCLAAARPIIASLSPERGPNGILVKVSGQNLGGTQQVRFGTYRSSQITVRSATLVEAVVPEKAYTAFVQAEATNGTAASPRPFTVTDSVRMFGGGTTQCDGVFTDPQGPDQNYLPGLFLTQTLRPATDGAYLRLNFTQFDLAAGEQFYVYAGAGASSPILYRYTGAQAAPGLLVSPTPGTPLTVRFYSNGAAQGAGWLARMACTDTPASPATARMEEPTSTLETFGFWPNPARGKLTVRAQNLADRNLVMIDAKGQSAFTTRLAEGDNELDVSTLRPGLYLVRCGRQMERLVIQ